MYNNNTYIGTYVFMVTIQNRKVSVLGGCYYIVVNGSSIGVARMCLHQQGRHYQEWPA